MFVKTVKNFSFPQNVPILYYFLKFGLIWNNPSFLPLGFNKALNQSIITI